MGKTLLELDRDLVRKRQELDDFLNAHTDAEGHYTHDEEQCVEVRARETELTKLHDEYSAKREVEEIGRKNRQFLDDLREVRRPPLGGGRDEDVESRGDRKVRQKRLGDSLVESKDWMEGARAGRVGTKIALPDYELKTLMSTGAGWDPEDLRTGRVVYDEQEMAPIIADVVPKTTTRMSTVLYMEETVYVSGAGEVAEGGAYGEAQLQLTERSSEVRKIAVFLPITDELFEDEMRAQAYVNNRLTNMLRQRLDLQLVAGNGTAPNLTGILNVSGINSQAKGTDPTPDAVYKAMVLCRTAGFTQPSHAVFHPSDWQDIRLLRTADGIYIYGSPADAAPPRIWGLPVVESTYETENTGLVGDFRNYCELAFRRGIEFEITNSHSDYFVSGKKAVRADFRAAFIVYRAKAFAKVTGI